jgi:photosystem II stability/assembly factor-like uncharacterized protein
MRDQRFIRIGMSLLAFMILTFTGKAQETKPQNTPEEKKADVFKNLKFRNLGPAVAGGRVTAVVGIPGNPNVYYAAGAAGGVFKTVDGGIKWEAVFKNEATASIGALALAPSNPNLVWVGTGEANVRNDIVDGHGVYLSSDAGHSWKFTGLADAGQISSVLVNPHNSQIVFVGALGHAWGPNAERGVFRTEDGGKSWKKVLYVDDTTGVADLVMEPDNPEVLYAAMWHFRRYPWTLEDGGESSGIYRSTDGGDTWKKLTEGLPEGPLGRIALAVAPSNPHHVYALIAARKGMLWQSMDMGDHWTAVSDSHALDVRPFYFSKLVVSPADEKKIYFLSYQLMESDDGGKTARWIDRTVHVDHHAIWIDPTNPDRIIQGNDGGVYLTTDGAKTWRFLDTLPIEQFYQVAADPSEPYTLCGGLQDNNAWCGPSSSLAGRIVTGDQWYTVVGGDGEYAVPAPSDPNIIYADSQSGFITRLDKRTHLSHFARPTLDTVQQMKPSELKYRFNWTSPIAVSPTDANEVYLGGNIVFKTTDGGKHWTPVSPDLTRNDKSKQVMAGEPVQHDMSGAETYDSILSITLAPTDPKVIWVGTDDGQVQVTRDGGKNWTNVTSNIPGAPEWARVYQVGVSPFDAGTAYVAFDAHMLDNRKPYVYKTSDYGKTWTEITEGLPADSPAIVVREDPNQKGLLVLGTDTGLSYSLDDGGHWNSLKSNFPTVPVYDLTFVKKSSDLVVATHGRGLFVLDDIQPLEELTAEVEASDFHLFNPRAGTLFHHWRTGQAGLGGYTTPNAPEGVVMDYFLKSEIKPKEPPKEKGKTPVEIVITDEHGNAVATEHGPAKAGVNRFVWSLRYDGPTKLDFEKSEEPEEENPYRQSRAHVPPGTYHLAVTVNGKTEKTTATVGLDPNLRIPAEEFVAAAKAALTARNDLNALNEALNRDDAMQKQLASFEASARANKDLEAKYSAVLGQAKELQAKLKAWKDGIYDPRIQHEAEEDSIHELSDFQDRLSSMVSRTAFLYGEPPNELMRERMQALRTELDQQLEKFNALLKSDVAAYNKAAYAAGAPTVMEGGPVEVKPPVGF